MRYTLGKNKKPEKGDKRRITKFLWIPRCAKNWNYDLEWRWLEEACIVQVYESRFRLVVEMKGGGCMIDGWYNDCWGEVPVSFTGI